MQEQNLEGKKTRKDSLLIIPTSVGNFLRGSFPNFLKGFHSHVGGQRRPRCFDTLDVVQKPSKSYNRVKLTLNKSACYYRSLIHQGRSHNSYFRPSCLKIGRKLRFVINAITIMSCCVITSECGSLCGCEARLLGYIQNYHRDNGHMEGCRY
jgi:hypothetical protein